MGSFTQPSPPADLRDLRANETTGDNFRKDDQRFAATPLRRDQGQYHARRDRRHQVLFLLVSAISVSVGAVYAPALRHDKRCALQHATYFGRYVASQQRRQLRDDALMMSGGEGAADGGAGDNTTVTHAVHPFGLLASSNSL
jgi:hypothetical protein